MFSSNQNLKKSFFIQSCATLKKFKVATAVREVFQQGYSLKTLRSDCIAGAVVSCIAVALGIALAIASGVPPQQGLYTVIIGGSVIAFLGGSRFQVSGPTGAFVVVLAPIAHDFGMRGLLIAGGMAGLLMLAFGLARFGRFIQLIPYPVTTGFTAGIACVIATLQLKDFLGLSLKELPHAFFEKWIVLFQALPTIHWPDAALGGLTLLGLILWPRVNSKIPAPLVILLMVTVLSASLQRWFPEVSFQTLGSCFQYEWEGVLQKGIPPLAPRFVWPWAVVEAKPLFELSWQSIQDLFPAALSIAILGSIESLLSAVVADGMTQTHHDPDAELIALGIGNLLCPFFGGIAATGAIARTATNIRSGAQSPLAAIFHAMFTLFIVIFCAPWVSGLPMASLAALLLLVAYHMSEWKRIRHILKVAPLSDVIVLLLCFFLTVIFDMVMGVTIGVILSALLFMKRMAMVTSVQMLDTRSDSQPIPNLPKDVILYEIGGPLFFGAAEQAVSVMGQIQDSVQAVIFLMPGVPMMDVTGLVAFEGALAQLNGRRIVLVGLKSQPYRLLQKSKCFKKYPSLSVCSSIQEALKLLSIT